MTAQQPEQGPEPAQDKRPIYRHPYVIVVAAIAAVLVIVMLLEANRNGSEPAAQETAVVEVITGSEDLCWSGAFVDRTVDGCGSETVAVDSEIGIYSVNAQKQSEGAGSLELILRIDGTEVDRAKTTAAYGVVSVTGQKE
jgi:hypothetical protein